MPSIANIRVALTVLQIAAYVLLLRKLFVAKLLGKYRYFSFLIAIECLRLAFMAALPPRTSLYAHAYFATSPVIWILLVLVVLEIFQLILKNHIGIATIGRKAVTAALVFSGVVSMGTLLVDLQRTTTEAALLFNFTLLERMVTTSLLVLLLSLVAFASHFRIPVTRNIRVHTGVFAVYFTLRTAILFLRMVFGLDAIGYINIGIQSLAFACLIAWTVLLSTAGEVLPARRAPSVSEERLLAQLEAINETLMRSARK